MKRAQKHSDYRETSRIFNIPIIIPGKLHLHLIMFLFL